MNFSREAQIILSASLLPPGEHQGISERDGRSVVPAAVLLRRTGSKRFKTIPFLLLVLHTVILLSVLHVSRPTAWAQRPARLQSFGCEIRGRCGQEFTLMPVSDNLVSAQ